MGISAGRGKAGRELTVDITCPNCSTTITLKLADMIPGNTSYCACGSQINFSGEDGREIQDALNHLEDQLRQLGNGLELKF